MAQTNLIERFQSKRVSLSLLAILIVVAIATMLRLHHLTDLPYGAWYDEAENVLVIKRILSIPDYWPVFISDKSQLPALSFYLYAPFVSLYPDGVLGIRLGATAIGVLAVLATYYFAACAFNSRIGVLAALFLAISRWHINFSRLGMVQIFTTLMLPLILGLIFKGSKSQRPWLYYALAGITSGIALQTYYSMVVVVPLSLILISILNLRATSLRSFLTFHVIYLSTLLLSYSPIILYATNNWEQFSQRFNTVSGVKLDTVLELPNYFLQESPSPELVELISSIKKHLLMFHVVGDGNGRHNLPGAPMLDPFTGTLSVIGSIIILLRFWRPINFICILWFLSILSSGIFSLTFEAPQAGRTLALTPLIATVAAYGLHSALSCLRHTPSLIRFLGFAISGMGVLFALWRNADLFFNYQLVRADSWSAYSTLETKVGEILRDAPIGTAVYAPEAISGGPSVELLSPSRISASPYSGLEKLPLDRRVNGAIFFVRSENKQLLTKLRDLYPHAKYEPFGPPPIKGHQQDPLAFTVLVSKRDINQSLGWDYECLSDGKIIRKTRVTAAKQIDFSKLSLMELCSGKIRGALGVPHAGTYKILINSTQDITLQIGGSILPLVSGQTELKAELPEGVIPLEISDSAAKLPLISFEMREEGNLNGDSSETIYSPKAFLGGLLASYHDGDSFSGMPAFLKVEQTISRYFHLLPLNRPFSILWSGLLHVPQSGDYEFEVKGVDTIKLRIDGQLVAQHPPERSPSLVTTSLQSGWRNIDIEYRALTDYNEIVVNWRPPGKEILESIDPSSLSIGPLDIYLSRAPNQK